MVGNKLKKWRFSTMSLLVRLTIFGLYDRHISEWSFQTLAKARDHFKEKPYERYRLPAQLELLEKQGDDWKLQKKAIWNPQNDTKDFD